MKRIALDLNKAEDRRLVKAQWRRGIGFVPGQPNEGIVAQMEGSPARLADYDDSSWPVCEDVGEFVSKGVTFAWYRTSIELPETIGGLPVSQALLTFETNIDDYGEVWVNGEIDLMTGSVQGFNRQQRVQLARPATPGTKYVIACLACNGPLGKPGGGVFMRYATLGFEWYGV